MNRILKALLLSVLCVLLVFSMSACAAEESKTAVNIAVLKGPTGMGMAKLMEDYEAGNSTNSYNFTVAGAADEVTAKLISGELDMAAIPTNVAAMLYNKTNGGVQILAVNTLGVLYILENGDSIHSVSDLAGKTVLSAGQGSTAEYVLNYVLSCNGLESGTDLTVEYLSEHSEAAAKAQTTENAVVLLPEPFVTSLTTQAPEFHVAINLTEAWEQTDAGILTMGAIAVRRQFAEENPEAVTAFLTEYAESVRFVNDDPTSAAILIEKYDIMKAAVAEKAIPNANIVCITGTEMKADLESFYGILFAANPASVGGKLPADDFYYISDQLAN